MLDIIVFCFWRPSSFLPIHFLSSSFFKDYLVKQKLWLIDDVHATFKIKMNFCYNSQFLCVPGLFSWSLWLQNQQKCVSFGLWYSDLIFWVNLVSSPAAEKWWCCSLTWDHKALNPYRCCPALSSSALTQGTAVWISVGSAGSFKVILYWDVWNFLMFHWHSASVFQQDWHMPDLDALVQFTPFFFPLFVLAEWVTWYSGLSCIQANLALASFQNALNRN